MVLNAEQQVLLVLLAQVGLLEDLVGKAHALVVGQIAANDRLTADILPFDRQHAEAHKAVVDKNRIAGLKLLGEVLVAHGDDRAVAFNIPCCKGEKVAVVDMHLASFERAGAVFGALGVEHDGDGEVKLLAYLLNHADLGKLLFVRAVGKIEAGNIDTRPAHGGKNAGVTAGRSDGCDDFCFSHGSVSFQSGSDETAGAAELEHPRECVDQKENHRHAVRLLFRQTENAPSKTRSLPEKRDRTKLALSRMHAHRPECSGFQTNRTRSAL